MRRLGGLVLIPLSIGSVLMMFCSLAQANGSGFLEAYADPRNPKEVFAAFDYAATEGGQYLLHSRDGGKTWEKVKQPDGESSIRVGGGMDIGRDFFIRVGPPERPRLVITYAAGSLWRTSSDLRWQEYTTLPEGTVQKLIGTISPDRFFVILNNTATSEGRSAEQYSLFLTETGGASWQKVHDKLPFNCFFGCDIFASSDGKVLIQGNALDVQQGYVSRDGGKTWTTMPPDQKKQELKALLPAGGTLGPLKGTPVEINAAMRGIKAEEIKTQQEFERARKR